MECMHLENYLFKKYIWLNIIISILVLILKTKIFFLLGKRNCWIFNKIGYQWNRVLSMPPSTIETGFTEHSYKTQCLQSESAKVCIISHCFVSILQHFHIFEWLILLTWDYTANIYILTTQKICLVQNN